MYSNSPPNAIKAIIHHTLAQNGLIKLELWGKKGTGTLRYPV